MARSEKNSFVIYYDLEEQTQQLSNEQLGRLLRGMFTYEKRNEYPDFDDDQMLIACFGFIKVTLDINREKYLERCEINAENGKKGGRPPDNKTNNESINNSLDRKIEIPKKGKDFNPN